MTNMIRLLAVIAAAQVIFIIMASVADKPLDSHAESNKLLSFSSTAVNHIVIRSSADHDTPTVTLSKQDGKWQTADSFPADNSKVSALLSKLADLKYALPVATSEAALTRFKVTDEVFERAIELKNGDKTVAKLYLGAGAGARHSHARRGDQAAVYSVAMGAYDVASKRSDWQDKTVLHLDPANITAVQVADLTLQRDSSSEKASLTLWKADALAANKLINQKGINDSLPTLLNINFNKVLGKKSKPEYGLDKPMLTVTVKDKTTEYQYQLGQLKDTEDYVLKRSDRAEYFQIAAFVGKPIVEGISQAKWLLDKEEPVKVEAAATTPVEVEPTVIEPVKAETEATTPMKVEPTVAEPVMTESVTPEPAKTTP